MSALTPEQRADEALQAFTLTSDSGQWLYHSQVELLKPAIAAAIRYAEAATWQAAIDAAAGVCRERAKQHDKVSARFLDGHAMQKEWQALWQEATACADAVAALTPPGAVDAGGETGGD